MLQASARDYEQQTSALKLAQIELDQTKQQQVELQEAMKALPASSNFDESAPTGDNPALLWGFPIAGAVVNLEFRFSSVLCLRDTRTTHQMVSDNRSARMERENMRRASA